MVRTSILSTNCSSQAAQLPYEIVTKEHTLSSGFPYDDRLANLDISPQEWFNFSDAITRAVQLSLAESSSAIVAGVGVGILTPLTSAFLGPFGKGPGVAASRLARDRSVRNKVKTSHELKAILSFWNEKKFKDRGFYTELVLPQKGRTRMQKDDKGNIETMSVMSDQSISQTTSGPEDPDQAARKRYKVVLKACSDQGASLSPLSKSPREQKSTEPPIRELSGESKSSKNLTFEMSADSAITQIAELPGDIPAAWQYQRLGPAT
jgi:hypothetical protein